MLKTRGARGLSRRFLLISAGSSAYTIIALAVLVLVFAAAVWQISGGGLPGIGNAAAVEGVALESLDPISLPLALVDGTGQISGSVLDPGTGLQTGSGVTPGVPGDPPPETPPVNPDNPLLPDLPLPQLPPSLPLPEIPETPLPLPDLPTSLLLPQLPSSLPLPQLPL